MISRYPIFFFAVVLAIFEVIFPPYAYSNEETLALCEGESNSITVYQQDGELFIRAVNQKDGITWLNTAAQQETKPEGNKFSNIRGEQTVNLFLPNSNDFCVITIGNQEPEQGTLLNTNMKQDSVTGTIAYREKIALPPGAVIKIKLLDISLQDVAATEIASQTITTTGEQVPIPFELTYDPSQIENKQTYAVRAEIYLKDKLAFTTTQTYGVITRGKGTNVNLILQKVSATSSQNQFTNTKWLLEDLAGRGVIDNLQTTLEFGEDNRLGGNGGCNRYFADYELNNNNFSVKGIGSTFKMCPEAIMNQERNYLQALEKANSIRLEGPYLFIDCEGYEMPLKFTKMS